MLRIAVIGSYQQTKQYVEDKFKDVIIERKLSTSSYLLSNGDILYLCYGDSNHYRSIEFDAMISLFTANKETEEVIKHSIARSWKLLPRQA